MFEHTISHDKLRYTFYVDVYSHLYLSVSGDGFCDPRRCSNNSHPAAKYFQMWLEENRMSRRDVARSLVLPLSSRLRVEGKVLLPKVGICTIRRFNSYRDQVLLLPQNEVFATWHKTVSIQ